MHTWCLDALIELEEDADLLQGSATDHVKPFAEPEPASTSTAYHRLKDQSWSQGLAVLFSSQPHRVHDYTI